MESYSNYRLRFLLDASRALAAPPLAVYLALRYLPVKISRTLTAVTLVLSIPTAFFLSVVYESFRQAREMARLGARPIPRIKGKLPGNLDMVFRFAAKPRHEYLGSSIAALAQKYNSNILNFRILWMDAVVSIDEQHIKHVLASGFENFEKGRPVKEIMEGFLGNGIFNRDGDLWRMHRAMTRPFFARDRVSDFHTFGIHAAMTVKLLNGIADSVIPVVDIQDLFARFTLDAATDFLFGDCVHTLQGPLPVPGKAKAGPKGSLAEDEFGSFAAAFEASQVQLTTRLRTGRGWPMLEFWRDRTAASNKIVKDWLKPRVDRAVELHEKNVKNGITESLDEASLLSHLVASTKDKELIRDEVLNILVAGRDTTAALLTFTVYLLSMHPDVATKLRKEITEHCGTGLPTYDNLRDMKYMRAVLNEVLRIFPPVPANTRYSRDQATTFVAADGGKPYYMPPNTSFTYLPILVHKRKDLWGEDAEEFDPERWIDPERLSRFTANPFIFVPFNAGPRICLGQQFAYHEASFFLCALLPKLDFELAPEYAPKGSLPPKSWQTKPGRAGIEKCWPANALTMYSKGGMWMKVTKLSEA